MESYEVLKKPILTEKATKSSESGIYTFEVAREANKLQIKKAVQDAYGVSVEAVRTMYCIGKLRTRNTKKGPVTGRVSNFKKAIVQLTKGETIDLYGNDVQTEDAVAV